MKLCRRCKQEKHESEFGKNRAQPDGLQFWCRPCRAEHNKKFYAEHPRIRNRSKSKKLVVTPDVVTTVDLLEDDAEIGLVVSTTGVLKQIFDTGCIKRIHKNRKEALVAFGNGVAWIPIQNLVVKGERMYA